ncbi:DUF2510 domain-containing protein [Streptomyces sp. LX-29]|uniref:DUF2510 domain-containing protein n=1 Tax=Streptomyces sp. LX-29 TaxID=2900152 RepID=UPI00240CF57E|nr:DUF2510 domain-containing protein [Streptomyces sp. LX-29]WFB11490.1 DUF2510 domain-containing protein [Streptomyces sp. LX-29]
MTTPPGWYPDPEHRAAGPAPERWWDGTAWTDHRREPQYAQPFGQAAPGYPGTPGYPPGYPAPDGGGRRGRGPKIAAVVVAAGVLVAAIVGGVFLLQDDGDEDKDERADPRPSASAPTTPTTPAPEDDGGTDDIPTPPPSDDPGVAIDALNGISLPVLPGWQAGRSSAGGAGLSTSNYPCPNDPETNCVRGGVFTSTATGFKAKTAEGIAKEDIERNAEDSYGTDPDGKRSAYGGLKGHSRLKSEAVTVAGQRGYLVRWKVDTKMGADGYVQSVVFPSPTLPDQMVLVRMGFDASDEAPPLSDMDRIVRGIKGVGEDGDSESV